MKIAKPSWWRPWFKYQIVSLVIAALNVYFALEATTAFGAAVNWFSAGLVVGAVISGSFIYRLLDLNTRLHGFIKSQDEAMNSLMEVQASDIGNAIAERLASGENEGTILVPRHKVTRH